MKKQGPIWLGLAGGRDGACAPIPAFKDIESYGGAFRLRRAALFLSEAFSAPSLAWPSSISRPPLLLIFGEPLAEGRSLQRLGAHGRGLASRLCIIMGFPRLPRSRLARRVAACYTWFTIRSAINSWEGDEGGLWKGRLQAPAKKGAFERVTERGQRSKSPETASGKSHRDENFPVASRLYRAALSRANSRLL